MSPSTQAQGSCSPRLELGTKAGFPPLADPPPEEALSRFDSAVSTGLKVSSEVERLKALSAAEWASLRVLQPRRNFKAIGFEMLMNENVVFMNKSG